jgi:pyruvate/2-oxoglutarate dehydrogenase complex dihydrolipoamide dehydrogenase (E3) component
LPEIERYDILVIGSGESGKYLAWTMAAAGHRTAVIEQKLVGGSCPNIACLPSKNVIHSAKVRSLAVRAATFGLETGLVGTDMNAVQHRKRTMVDDLIKIHLERYKATGVDLIMGRAGFVAPRTVAVHHESAGARVIAGERVFLNVGTRANLPDVPGLIDAGPMTHVEALELERVPEHLIVLGGGYVGLELAQAMRRFGSEVTVIERGPQLAGREDPDVGAALMELFRDEGIEVLVNTQARQVDRRSGNRIHVETANGNPIDGTDLLVAAGRTPNTQGIGADLAGVELDSRGYVKVNDRLETTAPGIWAMGDCAGSPQFTHVAFDDFRIVRDNLTGGDRTTRNRLIPFCMFTDPPLARVGINESEARARGIPYRTARMPMASVLRTRTLSEPRGFMKMLIAEGSDRILGFTAFGTEASELLVQTAMLGDLPYTALRDALFTHPTAAEGLTVLLANVKRHSRHINTEKRHEEKDTGTEESQIDQALADSFPASDSPPWTLGVTTTRTTRIGKQSSKRD